MLDHSICLLVTKVCDGNTHLHDNMPFVLGGRGGGAIKSGRLLQLNYERHGKLYISIARAMGQQLDRLGDADGGALPGL